MKESDNPNQGMHQITQICRISCPWLYPSPLDHILDLIRDNAYNQALNDVLEIIPKDPKYLEILKAVLELRRMEDENNKQYGNNSETIGETI